MEQSLYLISDVSCCHCRDSQIIETMERCESLYLISDVSCCHCVVIHRSLIPRNIAAMGCSWRGPYVKLVQRWASHCGIAVWHSWLFKRMFYGVSQMAEPSDCHVLSGI